MNEENPEDTEGREDEVHENPSKAVWSNKLEFILGLTGYTTGTSDFWRFPYLIWKHGGGTFILVFLFCAFLIAVPVFYLEVLVSQYSGRGLFNIWEICPIMKGMSMGMFLVNFMYLANSPVFRFWLMEYVGYSCVSPLPWIQCDNPWNTPDCVVAYSTHVEVRNSTMNVSDTVLSGQNVSRLLTSKVLAEEEFFLHKVLQISDSVYSLETLRWDLVLCNLIFNIGITACIVKSVESIGKVMYVITFLPLVLLLVIWIRTLIEPGAVEGMAYFFTPDMTKLGDIQLWVQAGFTAMYSLGPAHGGIVEIGSHASFRTNVFSSSIIPCLIDIFGGIFISMVVFSVIGVMASESGMDVQGTLFSGTSAAFVAFSRAFSFFPLPNLWLVIFFVAFLVSTSDIIIMFAEILMRFLEYHFPGLRHRRKTAVALLFVLSFLLNLPFCTQAGGYLYQLLDWYVSSWGVLTMGILECVVLMWIYGGYMVDENLRLMNGTTLPHVIRFTISFICPVMFLAFLILGIAQYQPPVFGEYHYPKSAETMGIIVGVAPLVPVLFWAILCLYRTGKTGFTKESIAMLFKPSTHWGPRDLDFVANHREVAAEKRGWVDTAYYNLTGRQRKITPHEENGDQYFMKEM